MESIRLDRSLDKIGGTRCFPLLPPSAPLWGDAAGRQCPPPWPSWPNQPFSHVTSHPGRGQLRARIRRPLIPSVFAHSPVAWAARAASTSKRIHPIAANLSIIVMMTCFLWGWIACNLCEWNRSVMAYARGRGPSLALIDKRRTNANGHTSRVGSIQWASNAHNQKSRKTGRNG